MGNDSTRIAGSSSLPSTPVAGEPDGSTRSFLVRCAALGGSLLLPSVQALAQQGAGQPVAVIYPDLGEPFRKVFTEMVLGIEIQVRDKLRAYAVGPGLNLAELPAAIKRNGARVVIALGRQGLKAAAALDPGTGVVVGGVSSVPEGERQVGVCLTPDPALLFSQLRALLPGIRRVIVIHNPQHNEWLLKLAREAGQAQGLELAVFEARDLAAAARLYEAAFAGADGKRDAVWLPIDPTTADEATIIPLVLRESWNRTVPVFSSSLLHVNKGMLFSLYPNNIELGRTLGNLALAMLAGDTVARGVTPLRDVYAALNTRTASHFGITADARMQRAFHYLYPPL